MMMELDVLQFGEFTLKSGRQSPYFFNLGAIHSGSAITRLGEAYGARIVELGFDFQTLFGPAYKGIPIAVATAEALSRSGRDVGWAFNRKEQKDHGEGGRFVGAPVDGRVLLVDDVLTAGTALREAAVLIEGAGAQLAGVVIALDRQERTSPGTDESAVMALQAELGVRVASILTLEDVIQYLDSKPVHDNHRRETIAGLKRYQREYCIHGA